MTSIASYIDEIFFFPNGNIAVFDQYGKQMPEYQGTVKESWPMIKAQISMQIHKPKINGVPPK